jgi:ATP-dependent DNA helicase RecG
VGNFLDDPLSRILGAKTAKAMRDGFALATVEDLLRHYPRRYATRGELTDLSELVVGEQVTVIARIDRVAVHGFRQSHGSERARRPPTKRIEVVVTDDRRELKLAFFGRDWLAAKFEPGTIGMFAGKVSEFRGRVQLTHPDHQLFPPLTDVDEIQRLAKALIPIYPATASLPSWKIAAAVQTVLGVLGEVDDPLPESVRREHALIGLAQSLTKVHRPETEQDHRDARKRLRFEEALVMQIVLAQRRALAATLPAIPRAGRSGGLLERFDARLPFTLTTAQRDVGEEIRADLAGEHPMRRLLQGEVGSGKTLVALRAMLRTVDSGGQAALLAPTEVLAQQHHRSICDLLGELAAGGMLGGAEDGTRVALLTGSLGAGARRQALLDAASGAAGIVVGTHALLEEKVQFDDLGLVVVDEQHRFGVEQRAALASKSGAVPPHVLVMTATPIPRTVAMTVFGDLDVSVMRELPPGRSPVQTTVVPVAERPEWLERTWQRIREEVGRGHQAYVVCTRIGTEPEPSPYGHLRLVEETEGRQTLALTEVATQLTDGPLHGLRIATMHGRLPVEEKDAVMRAFAAGEVDVLVSTTVIEVGVDVPNASVMVVLDAERFGVSQLHQLRGRVGRGSATGLCLLVTDSAAATPARQRLSAIAATNDGFALSQVDLATRREGDVLGAAQSGHRSSLRLLSVLRHESVIAQTRDVARELVSADPQLSQSPALAAAVAGLVRTVGT